MLMPLGYRYVSAKFTHYSADFGVPGGQVQMTLAAISFGFAIGQMVYGPMADSLGRKPVILGGVIVFALASSACAPSDLDRYANWYAFSTWICCRRCKCCH